MTKDADFALLDHFPKVRDKLYAHRSQYGTKRGVRLDIPSAKHKKLVVVSVHEKPSGGQVIGYDHSAVVKNARFIIQKSGQAKIGQGANKFPMSFVGGTLSDETAVPRGVPVYYDPRNVHLYVDAESGLPLKGAAKVNHIAKRGGDYFLPDIRTIYVWAEGPVYYAPGEAPEAPEGMDSKVVMPGSVVVSSAVSSGAVSLVVYHGTNAIFSTFDIAKAGARDPGMLGRGFYFSTDIRVAKKYEHIMKAKVTLRKPLRIEMTNLRQHKNDIVRAALGLPLKRHLDEASAAEVTNEARAQGFDGVVLDYAPTGYNHREVVAFRQSQIDVLSDVSAAKDVSASGDCCESCENDLPCEGEESMEDVDDPYDISAVHTPPGIIAVYEYGDANGVRALHHAAKAGDISAIKRMAKEMAKSVPANALLIPMPGRKGQGGIGPLLVKYLSQMTGRPTADVLRGKSRPSLYEHKKSGGDVAAIDLGLHQTGDLPEGMQPVVVDNVIGTGTSARAAQRAVPGAQVLVHAIDRSNYRSEAMTDRISATKKPRKMNLEEYLDTQAALYQMDGAKVGVQYIDIIDRQREQLDRVTRAEKRLSASLERFAAVTAARMPADLQDALALVEEDVAKARTLAKRGKFVAAEEALESAKATIDIILSEDEFREAAQAAEGDARSRSGYSVGAASDLSTWLPVEIDEILGEAYLKAHTLKADMDRFEEVPKSLDGFYRQVGVTANAIAKARQESVQLRGMAKRISGSADDRQYLVDGEKFSHQSMLDANEDDEDFVQALEKMKKGQTLDWGGGAAADFEIKRVK